MRMWNVPPYLICRQHLLGEHLEVHMFASAFNHGKNLKGYSDHNLVNLKLLELRHSELVQEMYRRGYNHKSPLQVNREIPEDCGMVDSKNSLTELKRRCPECKKKIGSYDQDWATLKP